MEKQKQLPTIENPVATLDYLKTKFPNSSAVAVYNKIQNLQSQGRLVSRTKKCDIVVQTVAKYSQQQNKPKVHVKKHPDQVPENRKTITFKDLSRCVNTIDRLFISLSFDNSAEINRFFREQDGKAREARKMNPLDYIFALFQVDPSERSDADIQCLEDFLYKQSYFQQRPGYILKQLSKILVGETAESGEYCFRQNGPGDKWYFLLRGVVRIQVLNPVTGKNVTVGIVNAGFEFGENSLFNDTVRAASAVADTPCWFLTLSKPDFLKLLGVNRNSEMKSMIETLSKFPLTSKLDNQGLKLIAEKLYKREFDPNQVVLDHSKKTNEVLFIFTGRCAVYREITIKNEK
jgi:CRP-like cAMP-binding protein